MKAEAAVVYISSGNLRHLIMPILGLKTALQRLKTPLNGGVLVYIHSVSMARHQAIVGVAPEEEDEGFDFEETLREIHVELEDLNAEAVQLAATIKKNFEDLGI